MHRTCQLGLLRARSALHKDHDIFFRTIPCSKKLDTAENIQSKLEEEGEKAKSIAEEISEEAESVEGDTEEIEQSWDSTQKLGSCIFPKPELGPIQAVHLFWR
ncbi:hypothetical protein SUGI_0085430 [Cryptomeria japonica]|nr:hypothetical protein SUGI_0085430 [Cryptomeria japonica]